MRDIRHGGGRQFGKTGRYLSLEGTAHFTIDPLNDSNSGITDISLAPVDSLGLINFSSDFAMLQPADPTKSNRSILFDVVNRGNKSVFKNFNSGEPNPWSSTVKQDPTQPLDPGNGFLLSGLQRKSPASPADRLNRRRLRAAPLRSRIDFPPWLLLAKRRVQKF